MPTEKTPITPVVNTGAYIHGHQQLYEIGKTNDLEKKVKPMYEYIILRNMVYSGRFGIATHSSTAINFLV